MLYPIQNNLRNRLDLSGIWDFKTDPEEAGAQSGWFNGLAGARPIAVPGSWNEQYEDLYQLPRPGLVLTRDLRSASWQDQRVLLRVGSANYWATVYVNGSGSARTKAGTCPFAFEITDAGQMGRREHHRHQRRERSQAHARAVRQS